jgi:exodeoxyribonuclease VII large subunit
MRSMEQKGLDFGGSEPGPTLARPSAPRRALTVSQLTERIQGLMEVEFFDVWVEGEVSNLKIVGSGHWYFSLKDDGAQIRAVVWKTAGRLIRFRPKDGMKVLVRGSVKLYPPRGEYQLSVEVMEPLGKGSLQQAFEDLKERLQKEGLFDPARKRPLPLLPRRIGVVTSPTGAVIQDFLRVLAGRYANVEVVIYPARVQGPEAAGEIVRGIRSLNRIRSLDVLVLARGGGSLEDLWPFNEEPVARAIAASRIPTLSAIGHETDFTIADFVADVRAPTPSAAAERVIQAKHDIAASIDALGRRLVSAIDLRMARVRSRLSGLTSHRVFEAERGRLRSQAQRVESLMGRAQRGLLGQLERQRFRLRRCDERVEAFRWDRQVAQRRQTLAHRVQRLDGLVTSGLRARQSELARRAGKLESLSPLSVLARGYALVWDGGGRLLRHPDEVAVGDPLRVRVRGGSLAATVTSKETE